MTLSRRRFLGGVAGAGLLVACGKKAPPAATPQVLDAAEWRALDACFARILPSDDGPGAREAKVTAFVDGQLATPELKPLAGAVKGAAQLLDQHAQQRFGKPLADLAAADQDAIVGDLANGKIPSPRFPQRAVFRALHELALEGFLGDPVHGGNAGMVGWKLVGFAPPELRRPARGGHGHGGG